MRGHNDQVNLSAVRTWLGALLFVGIVVLLQACTNGPADPEAQAVEAPSANQTAPFRDRVPVLPEQVYSYDDPRPSHFVDDGSGASVLTLDPTGGELDDDVVTVGRILFYDVNLSVSRTVRCASCHVQGASFADTQTLSLGVRSVTDRHSMALANAAFTPSDQFFWDNRADSLEAQIEEAITGPIEMALTLPQLVERVEERPFYPELFRAAYGDDQITDERVIGAIADFVRAMVSANAPYDDGRGTVENPRDPFPNFTDQENDGKELFFSPISEGGGSCSNCHTGEAQVLIGARNNGLSADDTDQLGRIDPGVFRATGAETDRGSFRSPSLRNIAVTEPYMHDGRFFALEAVVEHYNSGIADHPQLDDELRAADGSPVRLGWNDDQVDAVVAFLGTLTDEAFLRDPRFADPFR